MYRKFAFEGDVHTSLSCVPLAVRRKLDLVGLKISLAGWQALPYAERVALCHLPAEGAEDLEAYAVCLRAFAERAGVPLSPLVASSPAEWTAAAIPPRVAALLEGSGAALGQAEWSALDEEARFCLFKLADARREPSKFWLLARELGVAPTRAA